MKASVLIPAFRPQFLSQAIASVLAQSHQNYELLIGDDSLGHEVREIVERFRDPRIRYIRGEGGAGAAANLRQLWESAAHEKVKYLFDDDVLMPSALTELLGPFADFPEASFTFGHRDLIDEDGVVRSEPRVVAAGQTVALRPRNVAGMLISSLRNRIGEFNNVLMNRAAGVSLDDIFAYRGFEITMVTDVSFYLNASHKGPVVGISKVVSQFRKHREQNSTPGFNPHFSRGIFEWEIFLRGEFESGALGLPETLTAIERLEQAYTSWGQDLPELLLLKPGLAELRERLQDQDRSLLDESFRATLENVKAAARQREAAQPSRLTQIRAKPGVR